tara:strand:+ start:594 stop:935 length:342 start_codon:yes stop_codon:yes gene_type:complete
MVLYMENANNDDKFQGFGDDPNLTHLRVGTEPQILEILTDPYVIYRSNRYAPVVKVKEVSSDKEYILYISSTSLAQELEDIRTLDGDGSMVGIKIAVNKDSDDRFAKYEVSVE